MADVVQQTRSEKHAYIIDVDIWRGLGFEQLLEKMARNVKHTQGVFKTLNKGEEWARLAADLGALYVSSLVLEPGNGQHLYMGTSKGIFQSRDGGQTWSATNDGLENLNIRAIAMDPRNSRVLYVGTNGSGLFRSQDGGESWTHLPLASKVEE